ncbi:hypothetical protein MMC13_006124 [Lambiella insularis]|nr:hypothetical protein [Lambiella insularis]
MAQANLETLLATLTSSVKSATLSLPAASDIEPPVDGISLLDTKNELLLSYLQNLVFLIVLKLRDVSFEPKTQPGGQVLDRSQADCSVREEAVAKLVELRVYLERGVKPLEGKLRYQIDKVIRAAEDERPKAVLGSQHKGRKLNGIGKGARATNGFRADTAGASHSESASVGSDPPSEDDVEPRTAATVDPLAYRPNPSALTMPSRPTARDSGGNPKGIYRPPRITPTALSTTTSRPSTTSKRPSKSATLDEFVATELSAAPVAEPSIGSTIVDRGRGSRSAKERETEKERRGYEESNYVRLPTEGKKGKGKAQMGRMGYGGEDWRGLGEGAERVVGLTRKGKGVGVLERSRKREREPASGGEFKVGERFEKRRKALERRRGGRS